MCQGSFKGVSRQFERHFQEVSRVLKVNKKRISRKCFNEVLFCNFLVAWISSQLPEQKEGLLKRGYHVIFQKYENVKYQGERVVDFQHNNNYLTNLKLIYNTNKI